ncbi:unnamed protein product [Strongylus vulgaris]|uniref:Endonuclease/exonuclease/phosphatase domain-containing protein n=1 Tax=Strongylus vulgaris TaxID=40348 RepID=A0A3P7J286_STRVU|nr:unnamed protein product [Strongylus vulgaris]
MYKILEDGLGDNKFSVTILAHPRNGLPPHRGAGVTLGVKLRSTAEVYPSTRSCKLKSSAFPAPCPAKSRPGQKPHHLADYARYMPVVKAWQAQAKLLTLGIYFIACIACNKKRSPARWITSTASNVIKTSVRLHRTPWISDQRTRQRLDLLCTYNARTVSTNADLHALLEAEGHINYHLFALQETKLRRTDVRQLNDGTPLFVVRCSITERWRLAFVVHPSVSIFSIRTRSVSILSIRTRSYHLVWLSFDSVLYIRNHLHQLLFSSISS